MALLREDGSNYVPATGEPVKIVHSIERDKLDLLPGKKVVFLPWQQLQSHVRDAVTAGNGHSERSESQCNTHGNAILIFLAWTQAQSNSFDLLGLSLSAVANLVARFEPFGPKSNMNRI